MSLEETRSRWSGRTSNPVRVARRLFVGSTPTLFRQISVHSRPGPSATIQDMPIFAGVLVIPISIHGHGGSTGFAGSYPHLGVYLGVTIRPPRSYPHADRHADPQSEGTREADQAF